MMTVRHIARVFSALDRVSSRVGPDSCSCSCASWEGDAVVLGAVVGSVSREDTVSALSVLVLDVMELVSSLLEVSLPL